MNFRLQKVLWKQKKKSLYSTGRPDSGTSKFIIIGIVCVVVTVVLINVFVVMQKKGYLSMGSDSSISENIELKSRTGSTTSIKDDDDVVVDVDLDFWH